MRWSRKVRLAGHGNVAARERRERKSQLMRMAILEGIVSIYFKPTRQSVLILARDDPRHDEFFPPGTFRAPTEPIPVLGSGTHDDPFRVPQAPLANCEEP